MVIASLRAEIAQIRAEKDAEMAKMAKTCEVLVMKCELLELEKRSIEEKLGHVTQVASTASALVQKLDEALESHDAVLAETRAERDELRAALESTDRDVAPSPRAANGGSGEDGALFRTLVPLAILLVSLLFGRCLTASKRDNLLTCNFWLFYLLFPSNSASIFATFQCVTLDDPEKSSFLRTDWSIDCTSRL